jgi:anti-sigma B factor antagonist
LVPAIAGGSVFHILSFPAQLFGVRQIPRIGTIILPADRTDALDNAPFTITIRQTGPISVLEVSGRLTSFEIGGLRQVMARLLKEKHKNIVLNLSRLQYLDSSGIGELARNYVSVVKAGGSMKVVGLSSKVEEVLKITHLYQVFPEFASEEEALGSFPEADT